MDWKIGDRVLANWKHDKYWYPATIKRVEDERIYVKFDDGDKEWTTNEYLMDIDIEIGDKVYCKWKGGSSYYSGRIVRKDGDNIYIHYDDGDEEETTISMVRVTR